MFQLPPSEWVILLVALLAGAAGAWLGMRQLRPGGHQYQLHLTHLICATVALVAILLIVRASALQAVPLTSLFESMLVLTLVFGLTYLVFGLFLQQVWFSSLMSWCILALLILSACTAEPAGRVRDLVTRPWAIAHALAMALGGALICCAAAAAYIGLLGQRRLKQRQFAKVFGTVPNLEKLQRTNLFALRLACVFLGLGLFSGIGLAALPAVRSEISPRQWVTDPRVLGAAAVWLLTTVTLLAERLGRRQFKTRAYLTFLILLLLLGGVAFRLVYKGAHDFSLSDPSHHHPNDVSSQGQP
ncbi:MAG: cytochrome c biogenesis protein CcsA [Sedimentisphaerales bacterium]|nr:cytochrome c biogenesis protein CcsA [Sedimentisphaerales bacterium]